MARISTGNGGSGGGSSSGGSFASTGRSLGTGVYMEGGVPVAVPPVYNTAAIDSTPMPSQNLGGGGNAGAQQAIAAPAPVQSEGDYLAGDSQYNLQLSALMKALGNQQADSGAQSAQYGTDYKNTLNNLGWTPDDPNTPQQEGAWNFNDLNSAAGRSFNNQQNDYAGRGMLQSSLYGTANDNLTRSLNDQLGGVNTAKQSFMDNLARQSGTFASDNQNQMQQAKIESLARRANGVSLA